MTLHEAIEKLLQQTGRPMTTIEIANELNKNKWYQKKDGSIIQPFQIHGRTRNYPDLFNRNGSTVSLKVEQITKVPRPVPIKVEMPITHNKIQVNVDHLEKHLMDEKSFKSAAIIDNLVPHIPGLYCIRINDISKLPKPFDNLIKERKHNIIYIGIASQSLCKRFLKQELRATGHGTFFRSLGAVLGYRPAKGSLISKANKKNYTFNPNDEKKIIEWINSHLIVNWVEIEHDFENLETGMIQKHLPLLNLAKNPAALSLLSKLRAECVSIANS